MGLLSGVRRPGRSTAGSHVRLAGEVHDALHPLHLIAQPIIVGNVALAVIRALDLEDEARIRAHLAAQGEEVLSIGTVEAAQDARGRVRWAT